MKTLGYISTGVVVCLLYVNALEPFLGWLGEEGNLRYEVFFTWLFAPIWEEVLYRYFPLFIARKLGKEYIFPAVVVSAILFGWGHEGGSHEGVLLQGMLGLVFSWAYIKTGYKLYVPILIHILYNVLI